MASEPGPVLEILGQVTYHFTEMRPLFPTYLHLLVSAIFPIYTAAHASLARPPSAAPRKSKKGAKDDDDRDEEETPTKIEGLTPSDAILFPVLAGGTLASLYFILKWLQDPAWLNWALGLYFSQIGLFFATKFLKDAFSVVRSFLLPMEYSRQGQAWKVDQQGKCFRTENGKKSSSPLAGSLGRLPVPEAIRNGLWSLRSFVYTKARLAFHVHGLITLETPIDSLDVLSLLLSWGIVYWHTFISKPWFVTNFLGFSFCYGSLQFMTPSTAWTGTLVLSALFFYDIYFVFYTPMMVTVATKLDVPIKLLFPRPDGCVIPVGAPEDSVAMQEYLECLAKERTMAMLGLGDIVVPGMVLAFALRFDLYLHYVRQTRVKSDEKTEITKPVYASAKGSWGERFWTSPKLWSKELQAKRFPKPYLYATVFGYLAGMVLTVVVMQVAQHAQPALLYLVPGVLGSLWGTALIKGDLRELWHYSEVPTDECNKKKDGKDEKDGKKSEESKIDRAKDDKSEAKGTGYSSTRESLPATKRGNDSETDSTSSGKDSKKPRRLIYFSITLPSTSQVTSTDDAKTATEERKANGVVDENRQCKGDGEPPGRRARKS